MKARAAVAWEPQKPLVINPAQISGNVVDAIKEMTNGGADYSFECIGNVEVMRQALECCHMGWGVSTIIGAAAWNISKQLRNLAAG